MKVGEQQNHRAFQGRAFAAERHIQEGDVCALTCMELTPTFQREKTAMAVRYRPTLMIYQYQIHPEWGWMHARIQTWFPLCIHVCITWGHLSEFRGAVLFELFPMRMGHRCTVAAG